MLRAFVVSHKNGFGHVMTTNDSRRALNSKLPRSAAEGSACVRAWWRRAQPMMMLPSMFEESRRRFWVARLRDAATLVDVLAYVLADC